MQIKLLFPKLGYNMYCMQSKVALTLNLNESGQKVRTNVRKIKLYPSKLQNVPRKRVEVKIKQIIK